MPHTHRAHWATTVRLSLLALSGWLALPACGPVEGLPCSNAGAIRCIAATATAPAQVSQCGQDNTWGNYVNCAGMDWTCKPCGTGNCTEPVGCQPEPCTAKCSA
ncbi:MAG: hypothetical protein HY902_00340, partial [Deltaproteobacteria bacterium]|nr:hypothetical protein [Deltaproteobacteria bacterium]